MIGKFNGTFGHNTLCGCVAKNFKLSKFRTQNFLQQSLSYEYTSLRYFLEDNMENRGQYAYQ
jgi:hypothetical protein